MAKMNVTESNFFGILIAKGGIYKNQVSLGGRYHIALQGLCRLGLAELLCYDKPALAQYVPTPAGVAADAAVKRNEVGTDVRSKMASIGTRARDAK